MYYIYILHIQYYITRLHHNNTAVSLIKICLCTLWCLVYLNKSWYIGIGTFFIKAFQSMITYIIIIIIIINQYARDVFYYN